MTDHSPFLVPDALDADGTEHVVVSQAGNVRRMLLSQVAALGGGGGGGSGFPLISSRKITTPVAYSSVAVPDGYFALLLVASGITTPSDSATVCLKAGDVVYNDPVNFDTYTRLTLLVGGTGQGSNQNVSAQYRTADDSLIDWGAAITDGLVLIFPGDGTLPPRIYFSPAGEFNWPGVGSTGYFNLFSQAQTLNPQATVPPTLARITEFIIQPYGNGDFPPTSSNTITAGSWSLFGVPTPA